MNLSSTSDRAQINTEFAPTTFKQLLEKRMVFFSGKGGTGRTTLSYQWACAVASIPQTNVLWVCIEDPSFPESNAALPSRQSSSGNTSGSLKILNCKLQEAFSEYIQLKLGFGPIVKLFLQNKLIQNLVNIAPGIKEIVYLGKIWHEHKSHTHVIVDLPSSGFANALFQTVINFTKLFAGSPIGKDAQKMLESFSDPQCTAYAITTLPEESPMDEAKEHAHFLVGLFPFQKIYFFCNKVFHNSNQFPSKNKKLSGKFCAETLSEYFEAKLNNQFAQIERFTSDPTFQVSKNQFLITLPFFQKPNQMNSHFKQYFPPSVMPQKGKKK